MVTSIQMAYVTLDLWERDVIRVDQTGSVKTVVFVLPTACRFPACHEGPYALFVTDTAECMYL